MEEPQQPKRLRLRYPGTCRVCGVQIPARTEAVYERSGKTVLCLAHVNSVALEPDQPADSLAAMPVEAGTPGASARREHVRRRQRREEHTRATHPKLGGLILALRKDPQTTKAWDVGARGEEELGARLNELAGETLRVLHDRRIPRSRANIDHLAVTPAGVWVIDAKRFQGRPHLKVEGGVLRPRTEKLMVGNRNRTKLVDGLLNQVGVVREVVSGEVPVRGVLCFIDADWPLFGGSFRTRDVLATWPSGLYAKLRESGPLDTARLEGLHRRLAAALRPA